MNEIEVAIADLEGHRQVLVEELFRTAVWRDLTRLDTALAALRYEAPTPDPQAGIGAGLVETSGA